MKVRSLVAMLIVSPMATPLLGATGEPCSNNLAPYVAITKPTNGQYFTWGSTVRLKADAADSDGTITNVQFFADGELIGAVTIPPYTNVWPNVFPPPDEL